MAQLTNLFEVQDKKLIPEGIYTGMITKSSLEQTKDFKGEYIKIEVTILSGEYKNRKIFKIFNIVSQYPITVEIAKDQLSALCIALGKKKISDTQELHGVPFKMEIKIKPEKNGYPEHNDINKFLPAETNAAPKKTYEEVYPPEKEPSSVQEDDIPWS